MFTVGKTCSPITYSNLKDRYRQWHVHFPSQPLFSDHLRLLAHSGKKKIMCLKWMFVFAQKMFSAFCVSLTTEVSEWAQGRVGNAGLLHSWAEEQPQSVLTTCVDESNHAESWIRAATVTKLLAVISLQLTAMLFGIRGFRARDSFILVDLRCG